MLADSCRWVLHYQSKEALTSGWSHHFALPLWPLRSWLMELSQDVTSRIEHQYDALDKGRTTAELIADVRNREAKHHALVDDQPADVARVGHHLSRRTRGARRMGVGLGRPRPSLGQAHGELRPAWASSHRARNPEAVRAALRPPTIRKGQRTAPDRDRTRPHRTHGRKFIATTVSGYR